MDVSQRCQSYTLFFVYLIFLVSNTEHLSYFSIVIEMSRLVPFLSSASRVSK